MEENGEGVTVDAAVDAGRRKAMHKIAVGVGVLAGYSILPEQWTKPIIGRIVLPAHAGTSGSTLHDPCAVEQRGGDSTTETVIIKVTGFVTPPAANLPVVVTATASGGENMQVEGKTATNPDGAFEVFVTIGGGPGINDVAVTTSVAGADGVANCSLHVATVSAAPIDVNGYFSGDIIVTDGIQSASMFTCVQIIGPTATVCVYDPNDGQCHLPDSGPWNQPLVSIDGANQNIITFLEVNNERVRVRVEFPGEGGGFAGEGWLNRSNPCNLTAAV